MPDTEATPSVQRSKVLGVATAFVANIYCLRVYCGQIAEHADKNDHEVVETFIGQLSELAGVDPEHIELTPAGITIAVASAKPGTPPGEGATGAATSPEPAAIAAVPSVETQQRFMQALRTLRKQAPSQGILLRRAALMVLVSHLEVLHAELIRMFYTMFPEAFPAAERQLSLRDLREIGSLEEAAAYVVQREVEAVLRCSVCEQIEYMRKQFKLKTKKLAPALAQLQEVALRRNLFVHNDGVVNRTYLASLPADYSAAPRPALGEVLFADKDYLEAAIDQVFLVGMVVAQLCWRKWEKAEPYRGQADSAFDECVFEALVEGRNMLVLSLCAFADELGIVKDSNVKVLAINRAIALKRLGRVDEMETVLVEEDWSAAGVVYQTALLALRDKYEELLPLIRSVIASKGITKVHLSEWPIFEGFRATPLYEQALEEFAHVDGE